jgi:sugar phosphate permease
VINSVTDRMAARLPFFYGYVMIPVAMFVQIATSPGQTFAISAFTPSLRESLGMSDSLLSLAYMLGTVGAAIPLSFVGPLSDRYGLKGVTFVAVVALSAACYFASQVTGFFTLLAAFFLLRFLGQGSLSLLSSNVIAMWFRTRMGRVSAVMSIGTAIAFAWIPELISDWIAAIGWRATYRGIAVVLVISMLPMIVLFFRDRPEDVGQRVDGLPDPPTNQQSDVVELNKINARSLTMQEVLRTRAFYILAATNTVWAMAGTGILFYLFTLCEDRGFETSVPANLFKTFGISMLAMQLTGGVLADFLPLNKLLGIGTLMMCIGFGLISFGQTESALHGFAGLFGGGQGLLLAVGAVIWVRYYGRTHLGSIRGSTWCLTVAGSGCGPLLMGLTRDYTGGFGAAIAAFFAATCVLAVSAWWATPPVVNEFT